MDMGGYPQNMRESIHKSIVSMSTNPKYSKFCEILIGNQTNPHDADNISRNLMPEIQGEFIKILSTYCQELPNQVFRPSSDKIDEVVKICRTSYVYGHQNTELGLSQEFLLSRSSIEKSVSYYTALIAGNRKNSNIFTINDQESHLSGYIVIKVGEDQIAEVLNMYIDPNKTSKGLGSQLINQVLDNYKGYKITVQVASHNAPAIAFYKKNNFVTTDSQFKTIDMGDNKVMHADLMEIPQNQSERLKNWLVFTGINLLNEVIIRMANQVYKPKK